MSFGELDMVAARSVIRRYSTEWFEAAKKRKAGMVAGFPRCKKALLPARWYHGTFCIKGDRLRIPVRRGAPPLVVRLGREVPYPPESLRSLTLLAEAGRLYVDVTAALSPEDHDLDPGIVAGVDPGIIHPFAVVAADESLLVSGRGLRSECHLHLADTKARARHMGRKAPTRGQRGSRRWRKLRRAQRRQEGPATAVASARDTTRPPRPSSPGRSTIRWAPLSSGTPRGSASVTPAGARTCGFATGGAPI
jgi:putative transposase